MKIPGLMLTTAGVNRTANTPARWWNGLAAQGHEVRVITAPPYYP